MQEREISRKGQRRRADNRERRSFRGDDREGQRPPRRRASAQKIIADGALPAPERDAEQSDAGQVGDDDGKVQRGQAHVEGVAMIGAHPGGVKRAALE